MLRQRNSKELSAGDGSGVDCVDGSGGDGCRLAELQEKEPGEVYMYMQVQGNREHGYVGKKQ